MTSAAPVDAGPPAFDRLPVRSRQRFTLVVARPPLIPAGSGEIPVNVVVGGALRPRVVAVAGVHGDEREGPGALAEAWAELRPDTLAGTLVLVPVANVDAYRAGCRTSPIDELDMNRLFPGRPDGSLTERIAHRLFDDVVAGADFVVSLHSWYRDSLVVPYVEYPRSGPVAVASRAAAFALGLEFAEPLDWHPGLLPAAANRAGIPAVEPEIGGLGVTVPERRALYRQVLVNLLRHLGVLPAMPPSTLPRVVSHSSVVAPVAGMLLAVVAPGDLATAGGTLGIMRTLHGEELTAIVAPRSGIVAGVHMAGAIARGDLAFTLFHPEDPA